MKAMVAGLRSKKKSSSRQSVSAAAERLLRQPQTAALVQHASLPATLPEAMERSLQLLVAPDNSPCPPPSRQESEVRVEVDVPILLLLPLALLMMALKTSLTQLARQAVTQLAADAIQALVVR